MPHILIDARSLADPTCGGVGKVAKQWIINKTEDKSNQYTCFTTGLNASEAVKNFCSQNNFHYFHLKIPSKLLTLKSIFNLSIINKIGTFDELLLPNIAHLGKISIPYQILAHDLSFIIEPRWFPLKQRLWHKVLPIKSLYQNAKQIDCVSNQTKSDLITLLSIPESRCQNFTIQLTRDERRATSDEKPDWFPQTTQRFAIIFGGSNPRKNAATAVKAISLYNLNNPSQFLTPIVLNGKIPNSKNLAYVQAPDFINQKDLNWLYQHASILLYPSWYEGFGLPLHEAHQYNLPTIASSTGALPDTAPLGTTFCHPAKIHEWVKAIKFAKLNG